MQKPTADYSPQTSIDAFEIWWAGVCAVSSRQLVQNSISLNGTTLTICDESFELDKINRIVVVGAGKAGAGMALAIEECLVTYRDKLSGWVNVPADCIPSPNIAGSIVAATCECIKLHAARPAGVNEPTAEGVLGAQRILDLVSGLGPDDLCLVVLSGGGSALLPAPTDGTTLEDKQQVTRQLMRGGATINELNCVRKKLSRIKGGGLARSCRAGILRTLIISDVIGDPLDVIASGPTTTDESTAAEAKAILETRVGLEHVATNVLEQIDRLVDVEKREGSKSQGRAIHRENKQESLHENLKNYVIGNNAVAVEACRLKAKALGYDVTVEGSGLGGIASEIGQDLARRCLNLRSEARATSRSLRRCIISGGEPIVLLAKTTGPQKGGRNQELALAAFCEFKTAENMAGVSILSGGTDGEDGPTDAAGAWVDSSIVRQAQNLGLLADEFLAVNNSYPFFESVGGLLKTGPTHTNVMDVRVACLRCE